MIDFAIAGAVEPGMVLLLPWPNWAWRRFHVREVRSTDTGDFVMMTVRGLDGDDALFDVNIARSALEPVHVVSRQPQDNEALVEAMRAAEENASKPRSSNIRNYRYADVTDDTPADFVVVCVWCDRKFVKPVQRGHTPGLCSSICRRAKNSKDGRDRYRSGTDARRVSP